MNRRIRTLVVLAIAMVAAGLASFGVYQAIQRLPVREVEVRSLYTVVAAKPLEMGVQLSTADVKLIPWPASSPIPGSFSKVEAVVDRGLVSSVLENEPITDGKLAPLAAGAGLPPAIRPGMRAISVKVNEVIGVAGFVVPGTRVDVLVTVRQQQESMSRVVVSNVQVLTAGTRYDQEKAKKGEPIQTSVVTLMVSPPDAERIALAETEGRIALALRNPLDTDPTETPGIRTTSLMGQPTPPPIPRRAAPREVQTAAVVPAVLPPPPYTVEAIRAAKRSQEVVR